MISILQASEHDVDLIASMGEQTFIDSHADSASKEVLGIYVSKMFAKEQVRAELADPKNIFHLVCYNQQPVGYSKIILNVSSVGITAPNPTKLERLYIQKEFYGLKIGLNLFNFNARLSRDANQSGIFLVVWVGNARAISFYEKLGFHIVGQTQFQLSETYANPIHIMWKSH